jgi:hypothetical protein
MRLIEEEFSQWPGENHDDPGSRGPKRPMESQKYPFPFGERFCMKSGGHADFIPINAGSLLVHFTPSA